MIDCKALTKGLRKGVVPGDKRNGSLQTKLSEKVGRLKKKYYTGKVDNIFGKLTETAVKNFQKDNKLKVDGIAGPITLETLGLCNKPVPTPKRPNVAQSIKEVTKKELMAYIFTQPNAYTCGITASMMGFSVYNIINRDNYNTEIWKLAKLAKTNNTGTKPENLDAAITKYNPDYKMHMEKYVNLESFKKWIDLGCPIILHIGTIPELDYIKYYGHFIIVLGYDYDTNMVKTIDPSRTSKGARWVHLNIIKAAMNRRNHPTPLHILQRK